LVRKEQESGNELARAIVGWKLEVGMVVVGILNPNLVDDSDSDSGSGSDTPIVPVKSVDSKMLKMDIDIYSSAYANARNYYDMKKVAGYNILILGIKAEKTKIASAKALEVAEKKITMDLAKNVSVVPSVTRLRTKNWWEKFNWFVSTQNYLVVSGRDKVQTETLLKYFREGDVLVHSDTEGAPVVICKAFPDAPAIPLSTLIEAGTMCTCSSRAWEAKFMSSAFYVSHNQVSMVHNGQKLPIGCFNITGKKNFLPPSQLIFGMGLLFEVDELSSKRHYFDRRPWARDGITVDQLTTIICKEDEKDSIDAITQEVYFN
jgi:hypothetical protein